MKASSACDRAPELIRVEGAAHLADGGLEAREDPASRPRRAGGASAASRGQLGPVEVRVGDEQVEDVPEREESPRHLPAGAPAEPDRLGDRAARRRDTG